MVDETSDKRSFMERVRSMLTTSPYKEVATGLGIGILAGATLGMLFFAYNGLTESITLAKDYSQATSSQAVNAKDVQASTFAGKQVADSMISSAPQGLNGWKISDSTAKTSTLLASRYGKVKGTDTAQVYVRSAKTASTRVTIAIYGAGQARMAFNKLVDTINSVSGSSFNGASDNVVSYDGGVILTRGDVIISVVSDNTATRDSLAQYYMTQLEQQLTITQCASLDEKIDDAYRSFYYYKGKDYKQLTQSEEVKASSGVAQVSYPQIYVDTNYNLASRYNTSQLHQGSVPESPLPQGMANRTPQAVSTPQGVGKFSSQAVADSVTVSYPVADTTGAGCGWRWTGQATPSYDKTQLKRAKENAITRAENELNSRVSDYNSQALSFSLSAGNSVKTIASWDSYVAEHNSIVDSWNNLTSARNTLKPQWDSYLSALKDYNTWDSRYAQAQSQYESTISTCATNAVAQAGQNAIGDNLLTIEEARATCERTNSRPQILTQSKPNKPQRPTIAQGVTLPQSWATEDSAR